MKVLGYFSGWVGITIIEVVLFSVVVGIWYAIVGRCLKYRITSFSFAGFMIKNDGHKISITTVPIRFIAVVTLFKMDLTSRIRVIFETTVTVLMSITTAIGFFIIYRLFDWSNIYVKITGVQLIINMLVYALFYYATIKPAFAKGEKRYIWEQEMCAKNKLMSGVRAKDIPVINVDINNKNILAQRCNLYNYFHYLDDKQYEFLEPYILRFREIIGDVNNISSYNIPLAYEIIYFYSIIKPDYAIARHYKELLGEHLDNDMDLNGRRVFAAYLIGTDQLKSLAVGVINQGLQTSDTGNDFVMRGMEIELLNELKERLEKEI